MNSKPKIKRNDKCPCGNNKKYKACCLISIKKIEDNSIPNNNNRVIPIIPFNSTNALKDHLKRNKGKNYTEEAINFYKNSGSYILSEKEFKKCNYCKKIVNITKDKHYFLNDSNEEVICYKKECRQSYLNSIGIIQ